MTEPYTPSEDRMRTAWHQYAMATDAQYARLREDDENPMAEFDRFIARVRRDAAREALDGLAEAMQDTPGIGPSTKSHRARMRTDVRIYRDTHYPEETPCTCDPAPAELGGAQHHDGCGEETP